MAVEAATPGKEIIDATQNAVIEAAENVANIIDNTAAELDGHHEVFYQSAEFWVAMAFVLVVAALARPIGRTVVALLKKRIARIIARIREASALQEDAQNLLADYEKKFLNAESEAAAILKKAEKEVDYFKTESLSKLEQDMRQKEKDAEDRLTSAKEKASQEIASLTSELTIKAVKKAVAKHLDKAAQSKLIDNSIALLSKLK